MKIECFGSKCSCSVLCKFRWFCVGTCSLGWQGLKTHLIIGGCLDANQTEIRVCRVNVPAFKHPEPPFQRNRLKIHVCPFKESYSYTAILSQLLLLVNFFQGILNDARREVGCSETLLGA